MGDEESEFEQIYKGMLHPVVRDVEEKRIAKRQIAKRIEQGKSWIQEALTWAPYVGSVFEENEIGRQAAVDDVNIFAEANEVIKRIEARLGEALTMTSRKVSAKMCGTFGACDESHRRCPFRCP